MVREKEFPERRLMYHKGFNDREIAEAEGVTRASIGKWRRRRGLNAKSRPGHIHFITDEEIQLLKKYHSEGKNNTEISELLKRSMTTIHNHLEKLGLKTNYDRKAEGFRKYWDEQNILTDLEQKIIQDYHKHPEWTWNDLLLNSGMEYNKKNLKKIKIIVGLHLQRVCRSQEQCSFKPLLPENIERERI